VQGELAEHALDHRDPDDGEHLLGRGERQGTQPRTLAADEDDRFHYFVVVVDEGFVVVVAAGALDVVDEGFVVVVEAGVAGVTVDPGAVVDVTMCAVDVVTPGVVVVVATGWEPERTWSSAVMLDVGGLGNEVLAGTKPTVMSWRLANFRSADFTVVRPPACSSSPFFPVLVVSTHQRASTSPALPASGVPVPHFSPFVYRGTLSDGYFREVFVRVRPVYPSANFPRVALLPASLALLGAICRTPFPELVRPVVALVGEAAKAGSIVPQMSKARAACHVVVVVGSTTAGVWS